MKYRDFNEHATVKRKENKKKINKGSKAELKFPKRQYHVNYMKKKKFTIVVETYDINATLSPGTA